MNIDKAIDKILQKYDEYTDGIIGLAFSRSPFVDDFRDAVGLKYDAAYVKAFEVFMAAAHDTFRWGDYLEARTTAEDAFRAFYDCQGYPEDKREEMATGFVVSFINQRIDESQYAWEDAHPNKEMPEVSEGDINNLYLSRVFSVIPFNAEDGAFCDSIGVRYHFEQLHMCDWFASQITKGKGQYSRSDANYSARTTYNRLLNPDSLLWIGVAMGADKAELKAAADEMKKEKTNAARCCVVRSHIPFDTILQLYQKMMAKEE